MTLPLDLEQRLAALSPEKRALVQKRLAALKPEPAPVITPIPRAPRDGRLPLSAAQRRLWLLAELEGPSATYNVTAALRLTGTLRPAALEAALREIVRRHEVLRTTFVRAPDGAVEQNIAPEDSARRFDLTARTVRGDAGVGADAAVLRLAEAEARAPFDLSRGPLVRATLFATSAEDHVLVLVLHHIVTDGWSMAVLVDELSTLYRASVAGEPSPLRELPIQYADYAVWEASATTPTADLEYWRTALAGAPPALELVTDRPRAAVAGSRGGSVRFEIGARAMSGLRSLAESTSTSVFAVSLASVAVLLGRYSGQDDVVIGCPLANRHRDTGRLIGFFVNTLPVRVRLSGAPSLREVIARAHQAIAGAIAHQSVPFDQLVAELRRERDTSRTPLFQAVLAYQPPGHATIDLPDLHATPLPLDTGTAKFELTVVLDDGPGACQGTIEFNADLYDEQTARRIADHLRALIDAAVATPDAPIDDLEILHARERRTLLDDWAGSRTEYPRDLSLPALFDAIADRRPDAAALVFGERTLTYAALERQADAVAAHLRARGVRHGELVGVSTERSLELVAGILGVLKAGAAYVPLEASYPIERLELIARDAALRFVLTCGAGMAVPAGCTAVAIDEALAHGVDRGASPGIDANASDIAYVMYTSGSTGEPKGVRVPHRAIVRLVRGQDFITIGESDTFLQLAPVSFDASTLEIWGPLLNGARLAIAPPGQPSAADLGALIRRYEVTTLWLTSSLFNVIVDERVEDLAPLRQLLVGGDVLSVPHVLRAAAALSGGRVINGYGPTENTTFTCCHTIQRAPRLSVGDSNRHARSPTAPPTSSIAAGGPCPPACRASCSSAATGWRAAISIDPTLTAERFVPDPFGRAGRAVSHRRPRRAGCPMVQLQFLGRLDHQVKIRGFRVELGEIEAALHRLPGVRQAAVVVRRAPHGGKELIAYVVAEPGAGEAARAAVTDAHHLRAGLPDFMIPAAIVALETLPLTANGKIDRSALPASGPHLACGAAGLGHARRPRCRRRHLSASCCASSTSVPMTTSSRWAAIRSSPLSWCRGSGRPPASELPLRQVFDTPDRRRAGTRRRGRARPRQAIARLPPRSIRAAPLAAVVRAGAAVVPRPPRARQPVLQRRRLALRLDGALDARGARVARCRRSCGATRFCAPPSRSRRRRPVPDRIAPEPCGCRCEPSTLALGRAGADGRGAAGARRGRGAASTSSCGPLAAHHCCVSARRGSPRAAADHASHRRRRLVDGRAWSRELDRAVRAFVAGQRRRCRLGRSSTPTSRCGSAAGSAGDALAQPARTTGAAAPDRSRRACAADRPAAAGRSSRSAAAGDGSSIVRATCAARSRAVAREHGATLFMTLLAGFLSGAAGATARQDDIVVGTPDRQPRPAPSSSR